jgi:serine/threonine protein kinase/predicted Zn-dependent protease
MGRIFAALDFKLGREVAIKVLVGHDLTGAMLRRFEQEARAAARLTHPNIVAIHDIGQHHGVPFIVYELLHGETLRRAMDGHKLSVQEAVGYAIQLVKGLATAHARGVVHRDLKPENVFLTNDGQIKVLDFGIAKLESDRGDPTLTNPGAVMGTVAYMSPEQICGEDVDPRTDIFSVGAVLHEMLSAEHPFGRGSIFKTGAAILKDDPVALPGSVPPTLAAIVYRCLEKRRENRYQSAAELLTELEIFEANPTDSPAGALKPPLARADAPSCVAVMPFADMSRNRDQEYFSDGLAEEVLNALSRVEGLRVAARTSSFSFKGKNQDPRAIGKALNVTHLVEGSVRRDGDRVRVTAKLVDTRNGFNLWSDSYDRELKSILAIEDEVARSIVRALLPQLPGQVSGRRAPSVDRNPAAHELCLKGRYFRERYRADAMAQARDCFRQAVELDPSDPVSHAALADALTGLYETGGAPAREALPEAMTCAERALALDGLSPEAHAILGRIRQAQLDWNGAERAYRRAIELRPTYARVHQFYALMLVWNGRVDEAIAEVETARKLEPLMLTLYYLMLYIYFVRGEYDVAVQVAKTALDVDSSHPLPHDLLGRVYLAMGRYREAVEQFRHGSAYQTMVPGFLGLALAKCGETGEAKRLLESAQHASAKALICLGLEDKEAALNFMEQALEENDIFVKVWKVEPVLEQLRFDPRFRRLLERASFQGETA